MPRTLSRTLLRTVVLAAAMASSAAAQVIHNTGQGAQGSTDPFWSTVQTGNVVIQSNANLYSGWAASSTSRWISLLDSRRQQRGTFDYFTTFDLTGYDVNSAVLSGRWTADDSGTLLLNGNLLGSQSGQWGSFTAFTVNGGSGYFVAGVNTLTVELTQADGNYDAMNVDHLTIQANAVVATPEPTSGVLVATGFIGLIGVVRRRRGR